MTIDFNTAVHVVLADIRSAYNVGAIFRVADGAGVGPLHLCGMTPAPPHTKLEKTALGAERSVPWTYHRSGIEVVHALSAQSIPVIALETSAEAQDIFETEIPRPCALVLGHEVFGVGPKMLAAADQVVRVPLLGRKASLNVATAFAVVAYELYRRHRSVAQRGENRAAIR